MTDEFSVYWWDVEGGQHEEIRFVNAEKAFDRVVGLVNGPASSVLGVVARVIITDGGDCINLEWIKNKGVVFPKREDIAAMDRAQR